LDPVNDAVQARFGEMARSDLRVRLAVLDSDELQFGFHG
jgi:hypothetical protein